MFGRGFTGRLALWCARHRQNVVLGWLGALVVVVLLAGLAGGRFRTDDVAGGSESQRAEALLRGLRGGTPLTEFVVLHSDTARAGEPEFQKRVADIVEALRAYPEAIDVGHTTSYLDPPYPGVVGGSSLVSGDQHTALIATELVANTSPAASLEVLRNALAPFDGRDGYSVRSAGVASTNRALIQAAEHDLSLEFLVVPIAFIVLAIVIGAGVPALLPPGIAIVAFGVTFGVITLLSHVLDLSVVATNIVLALALAAGTGEALAIVVRYRERREVDRTGREALMRAADTAGLAVLCAGAILTLALLGLLLASTTMTWSIAIGGACVVLVATLASLTLLPAVLAMLGPNVDALPLPWPRPADADRRGLTASIARIVMLRSRNATIVASLVLLALAVVPLWRVHLRASSTNAIPERIEVRRTLDAIERDFPGILAPATIVVHAANIGVPEVAQAIGKLQITLDGDAAIRQVAQIEASPKADLAVLTVALPGAESSDEARAALDRLRGTIIPAAFEGADATVLVGGGTAREADVVGAVRRGAPLLLLYLLALTVVPLVITFRSARAVLVSMRSSVPGVAAALGVVVLVSPHGTVEAWAAPFLVVTLFTLATAADVLLLSRVRARFEATRDIDDAVLFGVQSTSRIATGVAVVLLVVAGGLGVGELAMIRQVGVGLGVAVVLYATVARALLLPAMLRAAGEACWRVPRALAWLPDLRAWTDAD